MSIRDKRLENDYSALQRLCIFHEPEQVKILETRGEPPEFYRLQISNCKGIEAVVNDRVLYRDQHMITISFPANYPDPGSLPCFQMKTPIFHPHIYYNGLIDFWVSIRQGQTNGATPRLDNLVKIVIGMIQYENWNFKVPANLTARDWANKNKHLFPVHRNLYAHKSKIHWK